jgi:hypothetical protein
MLQIASQTAVIVAIPGAAAFDFELLRTVAHEFGWTVQMAGNLSESSSAERTGRIAGVIFHRSAVASGVSWPKAIESVRTEYPEARLIGCYGFSEPLDGNEPSTSRLFHMLGLPLKENEVRQSLGFVWAAEKRMSETAVRLRRSLNPVIAA